MVKTALVDRDIKVGRKLMEKLEEKDFPFSAGFWFYFPEAEEWRLVIASRVVEKEGPKKAYAELQKVLRGDGQLDIELRQISVMGPREPLIRLLRRALKTSRKLTGIRFTQNTINNVLIEDAYIYRLL